MALSSEVLESEDKFDLTSMIDVVFLLLIYFMYLPIQQEADLLFSLPADSVPAPSNAPLPSELDIEIRPDGSIALNGATIEDLGDAKLFPSKEASNKKVEFNTLASTLKRLKDSADKAKIQTIVTIYPDADAPHQATISVLNSCAKAGIKQVTFGGAD